MKISFEENVIEMPMSYVTVCNDEMEYIEGGFGVVEAVGIISALVITGKAIFDVGVQCGEYVYNNGGGRNGLMMAAFKTAGAIVFSVPGSPIFNIGLDVGWVAAAN